jgi:hypothetical protein
MAGGSAKKKGRASPARQPRSGAAANAAAAAAAAPAAAAAAAGRRPSHPRPHESGDDRVAAAGLLALVLLQVPVLVLKGERAPISPLEIAAGAAVARWPEAGGGVEGAANAALLPGAWTRSALAPWARCKLGVRPGQKGRAEVVEAAAAAAAEAEAADAACANERALLGDAAAAAAAADVHALAARVSAARDAPMLAAGSALVALAALFGRIFTSRSALFGVIMIGLGGLRGGHALLPPLWMLAFLAFYSAFGAALERRLIGGGGGGGGGGVGAAAAGRAPASERARRAADSVVLPEGEGGGGEGGGGTNRRVTFEG